MSGFQTNTTDHLTRSYLYSSQLKEIFEDELMAMKYVDIITDFPDGDTLNIASIGQPEVHDYEEGQAIRYTAMDTGNFTFTITDYKATGMSISNKLKQDSWQSGRLIASFVPKQHRAIMKSIEIDILAEGPIRQTESDSNTINGAKHRWVASGTNEVITIEDFAKALYALEKANVPLTNLVAIVDPTVTFQFNTQPNLINASNNPMWEGIVATGFSTGTRFIKNVMGFDVYTSNNLYKGVAETIDSASVTTGVANLFFSAAPGDTLPIKGAIRQAPTVESEYNKDLQRDEYVTTCRYGFKLYRPENMVVVLSDTDRVYS